MDVEINVPQTPVTLVPGTESRLPIDVVNRSGAAMSVRLGVGRSRGGAWAEIEPSIVDLAPDARRRVEAVFTPPATVRPAATLLPFTVYADELPFGVPAGRATGLLTVAAPEPVDAALTVASRRRRTVRYTLTVTNRSGASLSVGPRATVDPDPVRVTVTPSRLDLPAGASGTATVRVRPRRAFVGSRAPYVLTVACHDTAGDDAPPLASVEADGVAKPRLPRRPAAVLAVLLLAAAMGAGLAWRIGAGRPPASIEAGRPPAGDDAVRRPFALVDVFPQGSPAGLAAARNARDRLTAAGMPVRLVDSTASDQVADGPTGLWVLLQDGMSTVDAARAYCDRYRSLAPKCDVVP